MTTLYYIWIGIMSVIGAGTLWLAVAIVRDYIRCRKYELEQRSKS